MTFQDSAEIAPTLPSTKKKHEAQDWLLVLTAEGIPAELIRVDNGFSVKVASECRARAQAILTSWQQERLERARRLALPPIRDATPMEFAAAYACALALLGFHLGLEASHRLEALHEVGNSQAVLVLEGEVWRLVTALTLHADLPHVLGNTLFGGFFLAAVSARLGFGVAVLSFVVTGTLGNLANAIYYGSAHHSIGASTGVFGLVGVLAGLAAWQRHRTALPGRGAWVAFGAALAIVAMLGSGGPDIDFSAHLFGLVAGGLTGLLLAVPLASRPRWNPLAQGLGAATALCLVFGAWARALAT